MKIEFAIFITNKLNVVNINIIKMMLAYDNLMEDNCLYWKNVTAKNINRLQQEYRIETNIKLYE